MRDKLFDYVERHNFVYDLSGATKLLCFLLITLGVMFSYDIRYVLGVAAFCWTALLLSGIRWRQVRLMVAYVAVFIALNFVLSYLFAPRYGVELYGTEHELFRFSPRWTVTQEQLLYQCTKAAKYGAVIPLGIVLFLTTNPSEFAASLARLGVSYKIGYALALTLRYFPDTVRDYREVSDAQQSRGLDMSKNVKLGVRVRNAVSMCLPIILSALDKIELISNAMDLRGFGKHRKRTWYAAAPLRAGDFLAAAACLALLAVSLWMLWRNGSRFWNPFV